MSAKFKQKIYEVYGFAFCPTNQSVIIFSVSWIDFGIPKVVNSWIFGKECNLWILPKSSVDIPLPYNASTQLKVDIGAES